MDEILEVLKELPENTVITREMMVEYMEVRPEENSPQGRSVRALLAAESPTDYISLMNEDMTLPFRFKDMLTALDRDTDNISLLSRFTSAVREVSWVDNSDMDNRINNVHSEMLEAEGIGQGTYLLLYNSLKRTRGEETDDFI